MSKNDRFLTVRVAPESLVPMKDEYDAIHVGIGGVFYFKRNHQRDRYIPLVVTAYIGHRIKANTQDCWPIRLTPEKLPQLGRLLGRFVDFSIGRYYMPK